MKQKKDKSELAVLDTETIYSILGNKHKRNIIFFLGERGTASFTEMRKSLKISVGNLYYNLDSLRGFVTKDEKRRYMLTEEGRKLYQILKDETSRINHAVQPKGTLYNMFDKVIRPVVLPEEIFIAIYGNQRLSVLAFLAVSILAIFSACIGKFDMMLLGISEEPAILSTVGLPLEAWSVLKIYVSWILSAALIESLCRAVGIRNFRPEFFVAVLIALTPILAYPLLYHAIAHSILAADSPIANIIFENLNIGGLRPDIMQELLLSFLFRIMQAFTLGMLTAAISVFKGLSRDRAFILVFILFYVSYLIEMLS